MDAVENAEVAEGPATIKEFDTIVASRSANLAFLQQQGTIIRGGSTCKICRQDSRTKVDEMVCGYGRCSGPNSWETNWFCPGSVIQCRQVFFIHLEMVTSEFCSVADVFDFFCFCFWLLEVAHVYIHMKFPLFLF